MILTERLLVHGRVQGVGFRWWVLDAAERLGLDGWVRNRRDGSVELLATGSSDDIEALAEACAAGPPAARVSRVERQPAAADGTRGFELRPTV
jgi:acylphosphatase